MFNKYFYVTARSKADVSPVALGDRKKKISLTTEGNMQTEQQQDPPSRKGKHQNFEETFLRLPPFFATNCGSSYSSTHDFHNKSVL